MNLSIGWIGAGKMGEAMIERLLDGGVSVSVWNRTPEKCAALIERGATAAATPAVAAAENVVFSIVLDDSALRDLYEREDGVLSGSATVWVDCSSVSPGAAKAAAEAAAAKGVKFVSAPVSGNPGVVRAGRLIFAVSGPPAAIDSARPYFDVIGRAVHVVGDSNQASVVKICTNALLGVLMETLSEVAILGEKSGVKREALLNFINDSAVGSPFSTYKTAALVNLDFTPTFTSEAQRKDLRLALSLADEAGASMPLVFATEKEFDRLVTSGVGAGLDIASAIAQVALDSEIEITPEN
ncbi:NAD(P)-dependent oxidoreductase [Aurantimicrobium minutum]|uniref:NAD(P)-dependent oxidoreductase n=1 Tax=Aurantimicrobium minutum TaxID=708131 RepID=UPI002475B114|nr:NAD(P)-dependent oxidoreductase [Aurantimicrobium minutum]MDH6254766.1 3-hydroxyisobutyrate dehydrogenase [Aurantimicrobium minutum]